jgi:phosphoribosylaminoimidazole-succinocarboxamide synthase
MNDKAIERQLAYTIEKTGIGKQGTEWDCTDDYCIATDRIHIHGRFVGTVPFKGQILATCTKIMCDVVAAETDVLAQPHPNILKLKPLDAFPVSFIVHGYVTDSLWQEYSKGIRNYHGHVLPQGLQKNEKLPDPIVVPLCNRNPTSKEVIFTEGLVDEALYEEAEALCHNIFTTAQPHAEKKGLTLVYAEYSFGLHEKRLVLRHGFHIPGTAMFWFRDTKIEFMQSVIHDWLEATGWDGNGPAPPLPDDVRVKAAKQYIELSTQFIGKKLALVLGDQREEIRHAIKQ